MRIKGFVSGEKSGNLAWARNDSVAREGRSRISTDDTAVMR